MTFLHQSRAITLLFINEFSPFAIQNHSSPISMSMQSLKKIGQKLLMLESGNKALTDGRMDGQTDGSDGQTDGLDGQTDGWTDTQNFKFFGGYNIISRHFCVAGYNK